MFFRAKVNLCIMSVGVLMVLGTSACDGEAEAAFDKCKQEMFVLQKEKRDCDSSVEKLRASALEAAAQLKDAEKLKEDLVKRQAASKERLDTIRKILEKLKMNIESGDLKVRVKRGKMALEMPSAILFESGKADLSEKGEETLKSVAKALKGVSGREFQVAGHTDNVKVSEDNPYGNNWQLSSARAISVVLFLKKSGINPRQLSAAGYAQYQPAAANKSKRGKARNRRIEITLLPKLKELPDLSELEKEFGLKESDVQQEE